MSYKHYPIVGVKDGWGPNNAVPLRRELNEWSESKERADSLQVVLFLLALRRFQDLSPENRDSYFQIAGIYGMPYTNWDEPDLTLDRAAQQGYGTQASAVFPLWHRSYLLLYEQRIQEIMIKEVVPGLPKDRQAEWTELAKTWRLPYWDWASTPRVPVVFDFPILTITVGDDKPFKIKNPLYRFRMPNDKEMGEYGIGNITIPDGNQSLEYSRCHATNRHPSKAEIRPDSDYWLYGGTHNDKINEALKETDPVTGSEHGAISELVYRFLAYPPEPPSPDVDFETINNKVHRWIGGNGGHMSQLPVASFDPFYWFHQCNIDRIFALWQTLNPDLWFNPNDAASKTPMRPFHKTEEGTAWTPSDTRDWYRLGYTYPELQSWKVKSGTDTNTELFAKLNEKYGINRKQALALAKSSQEVPGAIVTKDQSSDQNGGRGNVTMNDYALTVKYSKLAMGGHPFTLEVYLKREGQEEETFSAEDYVTNVYSLSQPVEQDGSNVASKSGNGQADNMQTAYIPVTSYLLSQVKSKQLSSMNPDTVKKFLAGLYYRVVGPSGQTVEEGKWRETMHLDTNVSHTKITYFEDPATKPVYNSPDPVPSSDTKDSTANQDPSKPGVINNKLSVHTITKLDKTITSGSTIIFRTPTINLAKPRRETIRTGIALLALPPASSNDDFDSEESYDVVLNMMLLPKRQVIQCNSKLAHRGYQQDTEIKPTAWFRAENATLRVDIKDTEWAIWVDDQLVQSVTRGVEVKQITHVYYKTVPDSSAPIFATDITATTYERTAMVPTS